MIADLKLESQRSEPSCSPISNSAAPRENYPWGEIRWPASRAACGARELTLGVTNVATGASNPVHRHPNCEEVLVVLRGEIEHFIEGTPRVRMKAGETIVIPRNLRHQARNVGASEAELLVAFSSAERETVIDAG
jgi:quercetin dioxygenase-like cupin family protein